MIVLGFDPGLSGAIAVLSMPSLAISGAVQNSIVDMPIFEITKAGKVRRQVDIVALQDIIAKSNADYAFIERVGVMPGEGSVGAFKFGWSCAVIEASIVAAKIPFSYVTPQVWKKALQCPKDKDGARMRAGQLMPHLSPNWPLKKHDGRAEAALIALWGMRQLQDVTGLKKDVDDSDETV